MVAEQKGRPEPAVDPPPQVTMGLLSYITTHSLDEDYAHVSERDRVDDGEGDGAGEPTRPGLAALIILGLFGLLVVTAAVQTSRNAVQSEGDRQQLIQQIEARSDQVQARRSQTVEIRDEIATLESASLETTARGRSLSTRLDRLGVQTGAIAVTGPGVRVVVDDAPDPVDDEQVVLDRDLQKLANALWASGAEAISINGQRLTNLSAIRHAGSAITVNYRSLSPPYVVSVIGDPDTIPARFVETDHGSEWLDLQQIYGLQFDMTSEESLTLPAANRLLLRSATTAEAEK